MSVKNIKKNILTLVCATLIFASQITSAYAYENSDYNTTIFSRPRRDSFYVIKTDGNLYRIPLIEDKIEDIIEIPPKEMTPVKIMEDVISVSNCLALKEDGTVWEWNEENYEIIKSAENVKRISAFSADFIVKDDGSLWGKGSNSYGQLAQGEMSKSLKDQIKEDAKWRNRTKCTPDYFKEYVKIMDDVKKVVMQWSCTAVLKNDGTVWTFGYDQGGGVLGIGGRWLINNVPTKILSGVKDIILSNEAGFALDENNTLWRWGTNYTTYSDVGDEYVNMVPEKYIENVKYAATLTGYNLIVKTDNSLWIYGDTDSDGGEISKEPIKLSDNVAYVEGILEDYDINDRALVLKENGDLVLYNIPSSYEKKAPYEVGKIMSNVRLPYEEVHTNQFKDISDKSDEIQNAIKSLAKSGIIKGMSDDEFSPDSYISRAEIAALILRMSGKAGDKENCDFTDVTPDKWYYNTAGVSRKYGIVNGFEDNTFRGDDKVSAIQVIALAARTLRNEKGQKNEIDSEFYENFPDWAKEDFALALGNGLLSKEEKENIINEEYMTRGDAAVILYRLYNKI